MLKVRLKTVAVESKSVIWKRHLCKNVRKLVSVDIYCIKAGRLCHHLLCKEVIAMETEYIICFMTILLLLVISVKK